ncbi:MAG: hypothetical protein IPH32_00850 [Bacteroidetes bacterium]|nr:hypothetical protein [Bacteroidota bacterium]
MYFEIITTLALNHFLIMNNSFIKKIALIVFHFLFINVSSQNICFNNSESYAIGVSGAAIVSAPGDFNGDGIKDLAVFRNNVSNPIAIMLGDNAGNYTYSYGTNAFCFMLDQLQFLVSRLLILTMIHMTTFL